MSMTSWAENEVKIACERERKASGTTEGEWDYGCACYESALKAFKRLAEDGHSGMSFGFTKNILIRLMEHKPLTPIEDTEENWSDLYEFGGEKKRQCVRMSSLFKKINDDGTVTYSDVERVACIDINNGWSYSSGLVRRIIDEMFPITIPYDPPAGYITVYCEDFLTDPKNGDFDTQGIFYAIMPDGERVEINKFYGENGCGFVEISKEEYEKRKAGRVRGGKA